MSTKDYIDLRIEQLKLKGADSGSKALGILVAWILIIAIGILALSALAFAGILFIGQALGNYALGALIVAGALLLILLVLFLCRGSMFRGTFVRILSDKPGYKELVRSEELNAVRLQDAENGDSSALGRLGLQVLRIFLKLAARK
ncbi:MAG: hypothetical protein IJ222_10810 [Bacteroidales bacterium]|nr:hypothetical protein [Bacteroidales bacterium]